MSDRLRETEPGTPEWYGELLAIAQGSDHPIDKALTKILPKKVGEAEALEEEPDNGA
jgi:hypothetical protein